MGFKVNIDGKKIAAEWNRWKDGPGKELADPMTLKAIAEHRVYLENRLFKAFMAGVDFGEKLAENRNKL